MKPSLKSYGIAIAAVAIAFVARWLLDPVLGNQLPYATFGFAILLATCLTGWRPTLLATGKSILIAGYFFVSPRYTLIVSKWDDAVRLVLFTVASIALARFVELPIVEELRSDPSRKTDVARCYVKRG